MTVGLEDVARGELDEGLFEAIETIIPRRAISG
jgi:hypothetical protein